MNEFKKKIFSKLRRNNAQKNANKQITLLVKHKNKFALVISMVIVMSLITYIICFWNRPQVVPNMMSYKNTQVHIISTINFSYISDISTQDKRDRYAERIPPQYTINKETESKAEELKNNLLAFFNSNQEKYNQSLKDNKLNEFLKEISDTLRRSTYFEISPEDVGIIYKNTDEKVRERLFNRVIFFVKNILSDGVYQDNDKIFKKNTEDTSMLPPTVSVGNSNIVRYTNESDARRKLNRKIKTISELSPQMTLVMYRIFNQCIMPNIVFDVEKTKEIRNTAKAEIEPERISIRQGEILADNSTINTPLAQEKIKAYKEEISRRGDGDMNNIPKIINYLICILLMLLAALFITISKSTQNKRFKTIIIFCSLLIINLLIQRLVIDYSNSSQTWDKSHTILQIIEYATPLILCPIIQVLLFGSYLGFIMAILVTSFSTLMLAESITFFILSLTASVVAIYFCDGARNRYRVILTGFVYGIFVAIIVMFVGIVIDNDKSIIMAQAFASVLGGLITSIIALGILPIIEFIFKYNSNIALLDYTDLNNKKANLLKTLQLVAPGTYHHSVMVSYVAEAAAEAVKANSTVCRVGALYHDIGKLSKPEFFSENQGDVNPHDEQNPSMSALIIKNHVSEGITKAEVEKMPHQIISAISQHHGTSIISYFYNKAKKNAGEKSISISDINQILREQGIEEDMYRHQGEKPKTVENAIIMIADSCEAASRSMKKITKHGLESLVDAIINGKMTDGQFDECPITVNQISTIKKSVVQSLMNINHTRIDYKQN